jgi:hypothetical protein
MVITSDCLSDHGSSILPRVAKLLREVQVEPYGLISHDEGGALPSPATKNKSRHGYDRLSLFCYPHFVVVGEIPTRKIE